MIGVDACGEGVSPRVDGVLAEEPTRIRRSVPTQQGGTNCDRAGSTHMYERRFQPPLPRAKFMTRLAQHAVGSAVLLVASLAIGMAG